MAFTVDIYKGPTKLGSGSATSSSQSITSWSAASGSPAALKKWVTVVVTEISSHLSKSFRTRVDADNGSGTLTLRDPFPFL